MAAMCQPFLAGQSFSAEHHHKSIPCQPRVYVRVATASAASPLLAPDTNDTCHKSGSRWKTEPRGYSSSSSSRALLKRNQRDPKGSSLLPKTHGSGGGGGSRKPPKGYGGGGGDGGGGESGPGGGSGGDRAGLKAIGVPLVQLANAIMEGWGLRTEADPNFGFKLAVECLNDAMIVLAVNAANRRERFLKELEFVICHVAVSLLNDVCLVWLLAPLPISSAPTSAKASFLSSLPQHFFQAGPYTAKQRLGCLAYKAVLYAGIGFAMGVLGTSIVHGLTNLREKLDPEFNPPSEEQPTLKAGCVWAVYMGISSNLRYQAVNGLEQLFYGVLPSNVARSLSVPMRLGNNFLGSAIFVWLAKKSELSQPREASKHNQKGNTEMAQVIAEEYDSKSVETVSA